MFAAMFVEPSDAIGSIIVGVVSAVPAVKNDGASVVIRVLVITAVISVCIVAVTKAGVAVILV